MGTELQPFRVSWSPDSKYLLYVAWTTDGPGERIVMVAVPVDVHGPAVQAADLAGLRPNEAYDDGPFVPIQVWGRR